MSARHWLERDEGQSPGLQRIQEAQQAAATVKAQAEQQARETATAAQEAERKRLEMIARIEQKTAQILPVLEEVKNFANATKTFPLGIISSPGVRITDPSRVVVTPEIADGNGLGEIQLQYGFEGLAYYEGFNDDLNNIPGGEKETTVLFGIRLKVDANKILLFRRREKLIFVPSCETHTIVAGRGGSMEIKGHGPYTEVKYEEEWQPLPDDETKLKSELAVAFHDPAYLGTGRRLPFRQEVTSQPKPQTSTGITGLVKGFLGLK